MTFSPAKTLNALTSEFEMKKAEGRQKWHLMPAGEAQATRCVTLQVRFICAARDIKI